MRPRSYLLNMTALAMAGFFLWVAPAALAQNAATDDTALKSDTKNYECNLSGGATSDLPACPGGSQGAIKAYATTSLKTDSSCNGSSATPYCGAKSDAIYAVAPIEAWNVCRWVDNPNSKAVFVPFKTANEWQQFRNSAPTLPSGAIGLIHCAVPYSDNASPSTVTITPPFDSCTSISANTPDVYGRTGSTLYPAPAIGGPAFSCHAGATAMTSQIQWLASDVESVPSGTLSWTTNFTYSPDIVLTSAPTIVDSESAASISWSIAPYIAGDTVSCTESPAGGWGPNAAGMPRSGTSTVVAFATTTYTLTCKSSSGLVSTASTTLNVTPNDSSSTSGDGTMTGHGDHNKAGNGPGNSGPGDSGPSGPSGPSGDGGDN